MFVRSIAGAALVLALTFLASVPPVAAQQAASKSPLATVAPFLDAQTIGVVRFDPARISAPVVNEYFRTLFNRAGASADEQEAVRQHWEKLHEAWTKAGGMELFFVFSLVDLTQSPGFLVARFRDESDPAALQALMKQCNLPRWEMKGPVLVAGNDETLKRLLTNEPVEHPELNEAFKLLEGSALQIAMHLPLDARRVAQELAPPLPAELGIGKIEDLAGSFRWAAIGIDPPPKFSLRATLQADGPAGVERLRSAIAAAWRVLANDPTAKPVQLQLDTIMSRAKVVAKGSRLSLEVTGDDAERALRDALVGSIVDARRAAAQANSMNNLKQIALAFHNFHDVHRKFPPAATRNAAGKPLLSWRVQLLPYLEQAPLYEKFKLDEPWDSEHNKQLIASMPRVFMAPGHEQLAAQGKTCYVVPIGEKSAFADADGISFQKITDGTSNTILTLQVSAEKAVIWTKPDDWQFDVKKPLDGLLTDGAEILTFGMCDGSVRVVKKTINPATWLKLLQINDGQPIEPF